MSGPGLRHGYGHRLRLLALPEESHHLPQDEGTYQAEQRAADRPRHEHAEASARQQHGTAEVLLQHRPQDETEHQRRRVQLQPHEQVAQHAEHDGDVDVVQVVVDAEGADAAEKQDRREQHVVRNLEHRKPVAHQRHVQDQQEAVADPHAGHQAPEQLGVAGDHVGTGLDALDDEGGHHQRHHRVLGNADAHQRDEAGARCGLVGRGLPGHALDAAGADLVLVLADLLVQRVGGELRDHRAATGQDAEGRTHDAATQRTRDDALELRPGRDQLDLAVEGRTLLARIQVLGDLRDAEASQRDAHDAHAVGQERQAQREALRAAVHVGSH